MNFLRKQATSPRKRRSIWQKTFYAVSALAWAVALANCGGSKPVVATGEQTLGLANDQLVILGVNELGMHCMNQDFADLCILPPFNSLRAQVIRRGVEPTIVTSSATVSFTIPGNTTSANKTNFWEYAPQLFGVTLPLNTGLTGAGLAGTMPATGLGYYEKRGIPVTPIMDNGTENAYPLATITAQYQGATRQTQVVVPVSWEISCNLCHDQKLSSGRLSGKPETIAASILNAHDRLHGTNLINQRPVLCASCHADPALGTTGTAGVKSMSAAMHGSHASRMARAGLSNPCYACHPGVKTNCQRDVHYTKGIYCTNCHGGMAAVGSTTRTPWVDEPKCGSCHKVANHQYEETGKLFKDSRGHGNVMCVTCHNAPHAITPATNAPDNVQTLLYQNHTGKIDTCTVCHTSTPSQSFPHER